MTIMQKMPMQYAAFLKAVKMIIFRWKSLMIFFSYFC